MAKDRLNSSTSRTGRWLLASVGMSEAEGDGYTNVTGNGLSYVLIVKLERIFTF